MWVNAQRRKHKNGTLDAERQRRLQELPGWTWDTLADRWEEGFSHLLGYVEREGHARVPQSYKVDGFNLGLGVSEQRTRYGKSVLNPDRQRRLKDLPGWTWNAARTMEAIERHSDKRLVP